MSFPYPYHSGGLSDRATEAATSSSVGEDPPWSEQYLCLGFTKSDDRILRGYKFSGSFE